MAALELFGIRSERLVFRCLLRANRKVAVRRSARKVWSVGIYENILLYAIQSRAKQLLECHGEYQRGARTSLHRRSTSKSNCNFIAFVRVRSTSFGNRITNDLFVGDHARHHFPTRFG
ncbi:MAG: hypothetical protein RL692_485 [Planctomycetota bacterium]